MNQKNNLISFILVLLNLKFILSQTINRDELTISDCFEPSKVSGCLNLECQKKICKLDNYCCIMSWDQLCVRNANYYCNNANKNLTRTDLTPIMNEIAYNNSVSNNNSLLLDNITTIYDLINENKTDEILMPNLTINDNTSNSLNEDFEIEQPPSLDEDNDNKQDLNKEQKNNSNIKFINTSLTIVSLIFLFMN